MDINADMDTKRDTDAVKDMDRNAGHGRGHPNLVSHQEASFESAFGANFATASPCNLTAPAQYCSHTYLTVIAGQHYLLDT
jgi:hypothetical protein